MINSGLEILFTKDGDDYNILSYMNFSKDGKSKPITSLDYLYSSGCFSFPFYKLVQNTPFKVIIYKEDVTTLGAQNYVDREMAKTWITLSRIYNALVRQGYQVPEIISYTPYYVPSLFYVSNKGVDYIYFTDYFDSEGNTKDLSLRSQYIIYYPFIFKKSGSGYYSICPPNSFNKIIEVDTQTPFYDRGDGYIVYRCVFKTPIVQGIPVFEMSNRHILPNIIPDKFNLDRW